MSNLTICTLMREIALTAILAWNALYALPFRNGQPLHEINQPQMGPPEFHRYITPFPIIIPCIR
jgi:hypothetical protein